MSINALLHPEVVPDTQACSYRQGTLQSISILYNTNFGARLLFTFYGELYVQIDEGSNTFSKMGKCSDCPDCKTSPSGATSVYECVCGSSTYFSYETRKCEIVKKSCPDGQFFSRCVLYPLMPSNTYIADVGLLFDHVLGAGTAQKHRIASASPAQSALWDSTATQKTARKTG